MQGETRPESTERASTNPLPTSSPVTTTSPASSAKEPTTILQAKATAPPIKHIWLITGPAGCGKTTVGKHLATNLSLPYIEGDEFHPPSNVSKMAAGHALTDADRWDWLLLLRTQALAALAPDNVTGVVLTCSALKRAYRDVLRGSASTQADSPARPADRGFQVQELFLYLRASEEVLLQRVQSRKGHYMKAGMVESQVEVLEEPGQEEKGDCITIEVGKDSETVLEETLQIVRGMIGKR